MAFAGQFSHKFNTEASMLKKGHASSEVGIQSSKARAEPWNKICIPGLGDDGAPELSAFAKLYLRQAEEACRRIISGKKLLLTSSSYPN
jgi:hypothetical protein